MVFVGLFIIIGYLNPNKGNEGRSIVAFEDIIYEEVRQERMEIDYTGRQVQDIATYAESR